MARTMQLEQALETISRYGFLCYDERTGVDLWTPAVKVPISLRRAIFKHRSQLESMMQSGAAALCPTVLHRHYRRGETCLKCLELEPSIRSDRRDLMAS